VLGNKYRGDERGCQDFSESWSDERGGLIVVCDGAGSAKRSHIGALGIAKSISKFFKTDFHGLEDRSVYNLKPKIIERCKDTLRELIKEEKRPDMSQAEQKELFYSFNTTLLFLYNCYITDSYYLGHIGDGLIIGFKEDKAVLLSKSETGDGGSNLTYFVSNVMHDDKYLRMRDGDASEFIGFMCFSDGLEDFLYLKRRYLKEYYEKIGHAPLHPLIFQIFNHKEPSEFKEWLDKQFVQPDDGKSRSDDDCSVALLRCTPFTKEGFEEQVALWEGAIASCKNEEAKKKIFEIPPLRLEFNLTVKTRQVSKA
jgi:hypothetical protein